MKRLLYIAYFFPPLGGAGVQRSLKFVRYLPDHGWRPSVLTGPAGYWIRDPSLLEEIDAESIDLHRAKHYGGRFVGSGGGAARSGSRLRFLRSTARLLLLPDAYVGWSLPAARLAERILSRDRFDAILTTSSPDSAHLIGRRIHRKTGLPWVADFRDPWTRRMAYAPPTGLHDRIHRGLERSCLLEADRVIVTCDATRDDFLDRIPGLDPGKIVVITNGYDEKDFTQAETCRDHAPKAPILHAGHLNPERPLDAYLSGLQLFLGRHPERGDEVKTLFLGGHYDHDRDAVRRYGLESSVEFAPNAPHTLSVAALLRSRILLLLEQNSDRGRLILPGKVFEYLRSGRPILAVVPPGGAADRMIRSLDAGRVADPARPEAVAEAIDRLLSDTAENPDHRRVDMETVSRFERERLAESLATLLDGLEPPSSPIAV